MRVTGKRRNSRAPEVYAGREQQRYSGGGGVEESGPTRSISRKRFFESAAGRRQNFSLPLSGNFSSRVACACEHHFFLDITFY
jgi:hypothetical protein